MGNETELVQTFPFSIVTARCIDCCSEFTGRIGVRFIVSAEGPGLEIVVVDNKRNEIHALGRVLVERVPPVEIADTLRQWRGHA